jgi:hypothetical protein
MAFVGGYTVFLPGSWDIPTFFFSYTMVGVAALSFLYWKIVHRTTVSIFHALCFVVLVDLVELVEKIARCDFLREGEDGDRRIRADLYGLTAVGIACTS